MIKIILIKIYFQKKKRKRKKKENEIEKNENENYKMNNNNFNDNNLKEDDSLEKYLKKIDAVFQMSDIDKKINTDDDIRIENINKLNENENNNKNEK